jgi:23S rRNA pseudouridine1911/1915/1917 synthase
MPAGASTELQETLRGFRRQALHAMVLGLSHPESGEWMEWEQEIPQDMQTLLQTLREDMARG